MTVGANDDTGGVLGAHCGRVGHHHAARAFNGLRHSSCALFKPIAAVDLVGGGVEVVVVCHVFRFGQVVVGGVERAAVMSAFKYSFG